MTLGAGTKLGRYEIRSKIGAGGMGEVYLAEDTKLDRKVALKVLPPDVAANQERMRRFVQEAKAASALNHPNIITIHEIDQTESGHFIAAEFIEGETLRRRIRSAPIKLGETLEVAIQTASALSAAHAAGIIHRDIKPENIMLRRDGIVKVLDFGLAKLSEPPAVAGGLSVDTEAPTRAVIKTETGVVMGTAVYMSPEQARGLAVDARTDIFSLGVLIYEMVAGRLPFEGSNANEILASILSDREPPPLARYAREIPAELERIVTKALRKNRDERYQNVKDLLLDLKSLKQRLEFEAELERSVVPSVSAAEPAKLGTSAGGDAVPVGPAAPTSAVAAAVPTTSAEYLVREIKSHKRGAMAVVGVFAVALLTAAYFLIFPRRAAAIDSIAVLPLVNVSNDPNADYLSDGISESLINNLTQIPKLRVLARSTVFRYKGKEADPQKVGRELGVRAVLTGRVQQRGDNLVIQADLIDVDNGSEVWGEQYNRSISDLVAVQQDIAREITTKLRLKLSGEEEKQLARRDTSNTEAYQLYLKGRFYWNKRTADGLKTAIDYYNQAIAKDPNYALAYAGLAATYVIFPEYSGLAAKEYMPKAEAAAKKALEIDETLAEGHAVLAYYKEYYEWDSAGAEREYKRAFELNPNYPTAHHWYSLLLTEQGRSDEALAEIKRAQELDPLSLAINVNVAGAYARMRQYDKAVEQYRKTLELDPNFPAAHGDLGSLYLEQGKFDDGISEYQKVRALVGDTPFVIWSLGYAYARAGKRNDALQFLNQLKQGYPDSYGIGLVYAWLGDKDKAFEWLNKAYEEHNEGLRDLKSPEWDPLRSDPRFAELLRRVGLVP